MKIIIIGAGLTGVQLARRLIDEGNDITLIDSDEETVRHASNRLDCMVIEERGNDLHVLEEAGIAKADALVAVTSSDEVNMITCSLVHSVYPDVIKIARVHNDEYYTNLKNVSDRQIRSRQIYGIDFMVHPEREAAEEIVTVVEHGAASDILVFGESGFELTSVMIEPKSALDGLAVKDIRSLVSGECILCYVENETEAWIPSGSTILRANDRIGILTRREMQGQFIALAGAKAVNPKKIALVGAGRIGCFIAEGLIEKKSRTPLERLFARGRRGGKTVAIIDKNYQLTKEAAARFPEALVYNADVTDEEFIKEENLLDYDLVISATGNHELNMVTAAYFRSMGVSRTVSLVGTSGFAAIARKIGSDVAVPIKDTVVDSILSHLRGKSVTGIHTFAEGDLEIIEYCIPPTAKICGRALKDVSMPGTFLVLILKKGSVYGIPGGDTILQAGDNIVFLVHSAQNHHVMDMLRGEGE
jgi:trk system potassium uptake protein TrkA